MRSALACPTPHGVALYAVTRGREVGIDLERIRFDLAVVEIVERFFSRREVAMLRALPTEVQCRAFFRCWTCKEAYIKGRGDGLSLHLDQFVEGHGWRLTCWQWPDPRQQSV